ncbi:MAG TPA: integrase arm-type DNA-binding domain-containing protein [Stellaceae bacterium]|jgi:integrase|nr:integrase arm-type DNA-binding domain-containing protein [Stellaceae bacterium]
MPKKAAGLTVRRVEGEKRPGMYADGNNLYLHVAPTGAKSWVLRYTTDGRRRDMGLGPVRLYSLAEARVRAFALCRQIAEGGDPLAERQSRKSAARLDRAREMSFSACAAAYVEAHAAGWRGPRNRDQWESSLRTYAHSLDKIPVAEIDVALVMKVLDPIWAKKSETASRVRARIEAVLDWAATRGYRQGDNPARWRGHLENLLPRVTKVRAVEHHAAMQYAEIAEFMQDLRRQAGIIARALEFCILTGTRSGEVLGARWDEFDDAARLWIIPAPRTKSGREHRVPLSDAAATVVRSMAAVRVSDFVFPGARLGRPLSRMAFHELLRKMRPAGTVTAHGFRSTFRDWAAEKTNFPSEIAEMALGHAVGDAVERAYRRSDQFDKRRALADSWAAYCDGDAGAIVLPLRREAF